ncbi:MAG: gliding motility lipoprotein GldD [Janthinobacterium lividum]
MNQFKKYRLLLISITSVLFFSCTNHDFSPKPRGFFRLNFPVKKYQPYMGGCPFTFNYPVYANIEPDKNRNAQPCWFNLEFPDFKGTLHLSYMPVTSKKVFNELIEDAHTFAFKHTVKATGIDEATIAYPDRRMYGIYYRIDGNAASSVQFYLTDSTKNYLRGALYFNELPRQDSIKPVLDFVKKDIDVMIKSIRWKN